MASGLWTHSGGAQGPISLRRWVVRLSVAFLGLILMAAVVLVTVTLTVIRLADRGGMGAAPALMEELRAVGNIERLIALGDQFEVEPDVQRMRAAALSMQALAFHPSLARLTDNQSGIQATFGTISDMLVLRDRSLQVGMQSGERLALEDQIHALWRVQRGVLTQIADEAAVRVVAANTAIATEISQSAKLILVATVLGALLGLLACVGIVLAIRGFFVTPLLGVSDCLHALRRGTGDVRELPAPRSQEMADVVNAIRDLVHAQGALEHLALHDPLTGLGNRHALETRLEQAMAQARRERSRVALMFIDLDRFKAVNDTLGHAQGDELLKIMASRLAACVRETDTLVRLGGDEFILALHDVTDVNTVAVVAQKVVDAALRPLQLGADDVSSSVSVGICLFPDDATDSGDLMKKADIAMYHAKARGRSRYQFFSAEMDAAVNDQLRLESALRRAVERCEFVLHYQPQIDARSGRIMGVEALIRWQRDEGELVPPSVFIPAAESTGLIVPMGEWVLKTACETLSEWHRQGLGPLQVAVNISACQFSQPSLVHRVADVLAGCQLPAGALELEVTESVAMENPEVAIAILRELKRSGVTVSIDDFGTGYSSLAYLKRLPIDRLKLDRAFVKDIETDPNDAAICQACVSLAHSLKLTVVAEGVETERQRDFLLGLGCDTMQGFLYSRPLPKADMERLLRAQAVAPDPQG